jgi:hypothetical protein
MIYFDIGSSNSARLFFVEFTSVDTSVEARQVAGHGFSMATICSASWTSGSSHSSNCFLSG